MTTMTYFVFGCYLVSLYTDSIQHILKRTNTSGHMSQKIRNAGAPDTSGGDAATQDNTETSTSRNLAPALVRNDGTRAKEKK